MVAHTHTHTHTSMIAHTPEHVAHTHEHGSTHTCNLRTWEAEVERLGVWHQPEQCSVTLSEEREGRRNRRKDTDEESSVSRVRASRAEFSPSTGRWRQMDPVTRWPRWPQPNQLASGPNYNYNYNSGLQLIGREALCII